MEPKADIVNNDTDSSSGTGTFNVQSVNIKDFSSSLWNTMTQSNYSNKHSEAESFNSTKRITSTF